MCALVGFSKYSSSLALVFPEKSSERFKIPLRLRKLSLLVHYFPFTPPSSGAVATNRKTCLFLPQKLRFRTMSKQASPMSYEIIRKRNVKPFSKTIQCMRKASYG